jgi:ribosome maturation factor RimP
MSLEKNIATLLESVGLSLYDTAILKEHDETVYRISVTSPTGVTLDQCVEATHLLSPMLDVEPPVSGQYRLEVGSPGIERTLKTMAHFNASVGESVSITTTTKEKIRGRLVSAEDDLIKVQDDAGETHAIAFGSISKARTYFEW